MGALCDNPRVGASTVAYKIDKSLRFNSADTTYLTRTPSGAGNTRTWTWSAWVKFSKIGVQDLFSAENSGGSATHIVRIGSSNQLYFQTNSAEIVTTNAKLRDTGSWYHLVVRIDTTDDTANDRAILYVNGERQSLATNNAITEDQEYFFNTTQVHTLGIYANEVANPLDGYMAEVNFVDGTALTPSSFGKTDLATGQWIPQKYTGSHGTNGFYLNFSDNSNTTSGTLGDDDSANTNDWTPNNFSVAAGVGNDSSLDTPTNNHATLNVLAPSHATLTNGNLDYSTDSANDCSSTFGLTSGKWYAELTCAGDGKGSLVGIKIDPNRRMHTDADEGTVCEVFSTNAQYSPHATAAVTTGGTWTTNDIIGIALDATNKTCDIYKNGSKIWGFTSFNIDPPYYFGFDRVSGSGSDFVHSINFGQRAFSHQVTGYKAVCAENLPVPIIKDGTKHFNTVLYEGTGSKIDYVSVGFQPDLTWIKNRDDSDGHVLQDSSRGNKVFTSMESSPAEGDTGGGWVVETADGFTADVNGPINTSGESFVAWCWKANGGTTSSNTDGSSGGSTFTSTVQVNSNAGFSIVTDTGNGSAHTIGHGLGVKPEMMIRKGRDITDNWIVYHKNLSGADATEYLELNEYASQANRDTIFNDTGPTSSVFSVGTDGSVNQDTKLFITYLFASVEGYSQIGSFTGNADTDGPFVYTGFKPAYVLSKMNENGSSYWRIFDAERDTSNPRIKELYPNEPDDEYSNTGTDPQLDFLSNGFKIRSSYPHFNGSDNVIYIAFAKRPFKYANAG